jgi:hypothetical protein
MTDFEAFALRTNARDLDRLKGYVTLVAGLSLANLIILLMIVWHLGPYGH